MNFYTSYSGRTSVQKLGKLKDNQVLLYEVSVTEDPECMDNIPTRLLT
jgi:hypothetical protein